MKRERKTSKTLRSLLDAWQSAVAGTNLPQPPPYDGPDVAISHLTEKTSEVTPGACFVARVRETSDGHPYIGKAIENGAAMILAQKSRHEIAADMPSHVVFLEVADTAVAVAWLAAAWEGFPARQLLTIGVTGTDGKTTTANILLSILRAAGFRCGLLSTTRAVIGEAEETLALHVTTPEAPTVQHHLRRMVDAGMTHCILEATSHGLAQHRVSAIDFDVAAVTNITHEHLDYHGDFSAYLQAKSMLFKRVSDDTWQVASANHAKLEQPKTAVLNRDDASYMSLSTLPAPQQLAYGIRESADVTARDIRHRADGTMFTLRLAPGLAAPAAVSSAVWSPLTGEFNVYNALAAATCALAVGATTQAIGAGLRHLESIDGRMETIDLGQPFRVIVDFAHTPNALANAIAAARAMTDGRIIVVFGSAGKRDVRKRREMARIATTDADLMVLTAEDPRTDSLQEILETMASGSEAAGGIEGQTFWRVADRGRAIYHALGLAETGDLVLICGKGHEQSMCFGTVEFPWDDREATRTALEALLQGKPMPDLGLPTYSAP